jgi:dienelactone hydrolase
MAMTSGFMGRANPGSVTCTSMPPSRVRWLVATSAAVVVFFVLARPYFLGLSFVVRAADLHGVVRRAADVETRPWTQRELTIEIRNGSLHGRMYEPSRAIERTVLLTSGLHPAGIDEPRLVMLARELAASGLRVFTPDIPQLSHFEITPAITDQIEDAAAWLATHAPAERGAKVGLLGISFSGGLSVVAAGRPSLLDRVAYVMAFGGHDDLPRVLHYLCTGIEPPHPRELRLDTEAPAVARPPHDYGVAVILLGVAERVVPQDQVEALRTAVRRYLWASHLDRVDKVRADEEFAALRELARHMPEPSATLLTYVNNRDVVHLGARLLPYISAYGGAAALSPSKSPKPSAPAFLLHGIDDNVIPAIESEYLAEDLRGHAPVRLLLSGLISHAEADRPIHATDVMALAAFWGDLLQR